ncbi:uncharacterized protein [Clytia hemisphaerica]|uniref:uncharacterized protein n=1 Tax=Clytia hemisphaerica TaxID=252671 RepID=UPI0034D4F0A1
MCERDWIFYSNQNQTPRKDFCSTYTDRKWEISHNRKLERLNRSTNQSYSEEFFQNNSHQEISESEGEEDIMDDDFQPEEPLKKRPKFQYVPVFSNISNDPLPLEYRHIRSGLQSVRPEYYVLIEKFISVYHMSYEQAEAAVRETANDLFGRNEFGKWKSYSRDVEIDDNTLPMRKNSRVNSKLFEAMALGLLVEDIMEDKTNSTCIVYSNDGSGMNQVGSYVVQSLSINGVRRSLPTFGVFSETKETLKDLQITTFDILSASSNRKYSNKDILKKISFVMSDSTAHNIGVIESVCEELAIDDVPKTLLCNVHPLMMFDRKIRELCQEIHNHLGGKKLADCFYVDVDFRRESFPIKAVKCLSNFICKDFSAKPWNYSTHFGEFIQPKENVSLSLKDSRFNRLPVCCISLIYLIDDIAAYLEKYSDILNNIAIIDRSFVQMEILKPIFAAISLLGIHVTIPYHALLMNTETNYSLILKSFSQLYKELTEIQASRLLTLDRVFTFVSEDTFQNSLPKKKFLLESLQENINKYPKEIEKIIRIALEKFAEGFHHQKGAIFGFGKNADDETNVFKISTATSDELEKLDAYVDVHNIGEERNVGSFNYACTVRVGSRNLESASRKVVIKSSADVLAKVSPGEFRKYKAQSKAIESIKVNWNEKMRKLQEKGYKEKDLLNAKNEEKRLKDLQFLKSQDIPGPFTCKEDVIKFMESFEECKEKVDRMYREVRYAKACSGFGDNKAMFRLKKNGKKLSSDDYQDGLERYFEGAKAAKSISMADLKNILCALEGKRKNIYLF